MPCSCTPQLCHILIGPHNAAFYKLLDELWGEAEDLMDRGISGSGQGFDAPSAGRLGSHAFIPTHNPPEHRMADAIRKVRPHMQDSSQASIQLAPQTKSSTRCLSSVILHCQAYWFIVESGVTCCVRCCYRVCA